MLAAFPKRAKPSQIAEIIRVKAKYLEEFFLDDAFCGKPAQVNR